MKEYLKDVDEVLAEEQSGHYGLTAEEAGKRLEKYGYNRLEAAKKDGIVKKFLAQLTDPMIIILLAAALVSGITSFYANESFADVIIILIVVIINAVLGVLQESKAEKAIEALQKMAAPLSKVVRGGVQTTVKSEELVPGDIILLEAGDAVPADARIIESASLKVEEAALTGESVPVDKLIRALKLEGEKDVPLGDRKNMTYMGSTVVYGRGKAVVVDTGMSTEMGKIAGALAEAKDEQTPLQKKLGQLSKILSGLVIGICVIVFGISLFRMYPNIEAGAVLDTFMVAVSLAVAAIPEGLAAVVTIVLSIGVTNMSARKAVIRKLTAVETLGCTSVICSDKTGTLTQNKMTVLQHYTGDEEEHVLAMALCNDAKPGEDGTAVGEPTECALVNDALNLGLYDKTEGWHRVGEAPFDSDRKMMSVLFENEGKLIQYTKGAPDEVLRCCTKIRKDGKAVPMTEEDKKAVLAANKEMADKALRVLCSARRDWDSFPASESGEQGGSMPAGISPEVLENDLCFIGLSGMIDPVRPEVVAAIEECRQAGITPVMITGDHRDTAAAIASELGILEEGCMAITGSDLNDISDSDLLENIEKYRVYARVQPEHKVRIVKTWKEKGNITAMTGDGVNDAPSIKNADIGVGMGITGTDVTKNVADMVLADDNFATIVAAVEEGRRIYANIRKSIQFLLSSNLAEVISIFTATILGFVILKPVHILWINLITDCFPALALGMEKAEKDIMKRPPRSSEDGIFAGGMGADIAFQGFVIAALTLISYFVGHFMEKGVWEITTSPDGITMAFLTLSLVEIFHSFNMRSRRGSIFKMTTRNLWLWGSMVLSLILTTVVVYVPFLSAAFSFEHISLVEYATAVGIALLIIPIMEIVKAIQRSVERRGE